MAPYHRLSRYRNLDEHNKMDNEGSEVNWTLCVAFYTKKLCPRPARDLAMEIRSIDQLIKQTKL